MLSSGKESRWMALPQPNWLLFTELPGRVCNKHLKKKQKNGFQRKAAHLFSIVNLQWVLEVNDTIN